MTNPYLPKIALCLSGEPRNTMFCFPYIYETLLIHKNLFEIDVYVHTFKGFRALPLYDPKSFIIDDLNEDVFYWDCVQDIENLYPEHGLTFETQSALPLKNFLLMFYGMKKCFSLTKGNNYDYYIRCRPDIMFSKFFSLPHMIHDLQTKNYDIITPSNFPADGYKSRINDQFAIGKSQPMEIYFDIFSHLPELIKSTKSYIPEILLKQHLTNNNIKILETKFFMNLIRKINIISHPLSPNYFD